MRDNSQINGAQDKRPARADVSLIVTMTLLAIFIPFAGAILAIIVGLATRRRRGYGTLTIIGVVALIVWLTLQYTVFRSPDHLFPWEECRYIEVRNARNILTLKNALEEYSRDHDEKYPTSISILVEEGYILFGLPKNPYAFRRIRQLPPGSTPVNGDFTYIPITVEGEVRSYYLIGYGHYFYEEAHIVLIVTPENDYYSDPILEMVEQLLEEATIDSSPNSD